MEKTMRAAVLYGPEDVRLEEVPVPVIGRGEVLVRIKAALTCGTDAKVYLRGGHPRMIKPPAVFGHEFSGVVEAVGEGVRDFRPGDRVVAANSAPCNECRYCRLGRESLCEDLLFINGAYAEFVKIPERIVRQNLIKFGERLSFEEAAVTEPLACAFHGVEESGIRHGDTVVINGAGPIGLLFLQLVKLKGARAIICDTMPERLNTARVLGADETVNAGAVDDQVGAVRALTYGGAGVDVGIEAVGTPETWEKTIAMARKGGLINLFGGCKPGTRISIDTARLHYDELTIKAVFHHTPETVRRTVNLLEWGLVNGRAIITGRLPLEDVKKALSLIVKHEGLKTAVLPGGEGT